jgi:hypothetical protein
MSAFLHFSFITLCSCRLDSNLPHTHPSTHAHRHPALGVSSLQLAIKRTSSRHDRVRSLSRFVVWHALDAVYASVSVRVTNPNVCLKPLPHPAKGAHCPGCCLTYV